MDIIKSNWQNVFFGFILNGLLLFILFRFIKYIAPVIFRRPPVRRKIRQYLPFIETLFWIVFLAWNVIRFSHSNQLFAIVLSVALLGILFWISKFGIKDLMAGMILRMISGYKNGDAVRFAQIDGKIKHWAALRLEIENQAGELLRIPYSQIISEVLIHAEDQQFSSMHVFSFPISSPIDSDELASSIRRYILELPWSSVHKPPEVSIDKKSDDRFLVQVSCFPFEKAYAKNIENKVLEKFATQTVDSVNSINQ